MGYLGTLAAGSGLLGPAGILYGLYSSMNTIMNKNNKPEVPSSQPGVSGNNQIKTPDNKPSVLNSTPLRNLVFNPVRSVYNTAFGRSNNLMPTGINTSFNKFNNSNISNISTTKPSITNSNKNINGSYMNNYSGKPSSGIEGMPSTTHQKTANWFNKHADFDVERLAENAALGAGASTAFGVPSLFVSLGAHKPTDKLLQDNSLTLNSYQKGLTGIKKFNIIRRNEGLAAALHKLSEVNGGKKGILGALAAGSAIAAIPTSATSLLGD